MYTYKCANKNTQTTVNVFMKSTTMVHLFSIKLRLVTNVQMTDEAGGKVGSFQVIMLDLSRFFLNGKIIPHASW